MKSIKYGLVALLTCCVLTGATVGKAQNFPTDYSSNLLETISFGDCTNWTDDFNYPPLSWTNLTSVAGDGLAVLMDTNISLLQYPIVVQGNTWTNLTLNQGTVSMWVFLTNSSSGVWSLDPGQRGTFIQAGSYTPDASYGWWSLYTEGSNILFGTQDNHGAQTNYLCAPINWSVASNQWIQLTLTYAPNTNATKLYINGALATNGPAMSVVPDTTVISNSFYVGSSGSSNLLHAAIDDIYFWNCPLDAASINDFYQSAYPNYFLNPNGIGWVQGDVISSAPFYTTNNSRAIAGAGFLQFVGTAPYWTSSGQVWMTNISAVVGPGGSTTLYFSVMGGSNGLAYDVYATAALAGSGITNSAWSWMGQVYAGGRFALGGLPSTAAYVVLGQPTDQDADGLCNSYELLVSHSSPTDPGSDLPQGWLWAYFGDFNHSSSDRDSLGAYTLLDDFTYGLDPNVVNFSISVTNQYVTGREIPVQVGVSAGAPASMALLVDSTNLAAATWVPYSSNLTAMTVVIGTNEGWHDIYVGMRGRPINSQQTWQGVRVKLDTRPPALVITGPTNSNVSVSMIQLTGYSAEALSRLTYDISNATGMLTDQSAVVTGQYYDTNTAEFTTNYFQAYDVLPAEGLNVLTLHAVDLAGNMATLTTNFLYSANTNPAVVSLLWPQDTLQMSGSSFTIKGQVNDPTASVSVAVTDTNGNVSVLAGRAGRDGIFWIENVPLFPGTNLLALTVSRPGVDTTTNITLIQSGVGLTINTVQAGDTTVGGAMDTAGYTIWVNGTKATQDGNTWTNQITPIGAVGGLVLVTAIPNSDYGGNGSGGGAGVNPYSAQAINTQATVQPAEGVYISAYHYNDQVESTLYYYGEDSTLVPVDVTPYDIFNWEDGKGGNEQTYFYDGMALAPGLWTTLWPTTAWPQALTNGTGMDTEWDYYVSPPDIWSNTYTEFPPSLKVEHCDINETIDRYGSRERRTADTELTLATGGPLGSTEKNFWTISATATIYADEADNVGVPVPPEQIYIRNFGHLDTNGNLVVVLPDNDPDVITPSFCGGLGRGLATVTAVRNTLVSVCEAIGLPSTNRYTVGVGEKVDLSFNPEPSAPVKWAIPFNQNGKLYPTTGSATTFTAPSLGGRTSVTVSSGVATNTITFNVLEPTNVHHVIIIATNNIRRAPDFTNGQAGAKMLLRVVMGPTNVSFVHVQMHEVPLAASSITGYFTNVPAGDLVHNTARANWFGLGDDNSWYDTCYLTGCGQPWSEGSFTWNVPWDWQMEPGKGYSAFDNAMTNGWQQVFMINTNGTVTIRKFERNWVQRTTNDVITVTNTP